MADRAGGTVPRMPQRTITLDLHADRIYFVEQKVAGSWRVTNPESFFSVIDERRARAVLVGAERMG